MGKSLNKRRVYQEVGCGRLLVLVCHVGGRVLKVLLGLHALHLAAGDERVIVLEGRRRDVLIV